MKQMEWKIPAILTIGMLFSSSVLADYSKGFDGYRIFKNNCTLCHGEDGSGNGPLASKLSEKPADLSDNDKLSKRSDHDLFRIIEGTAPHGQVGNEMPKWGLSLPQTEINSLVSYIRYLHTSKYPVSGNPEKGKQTYNEKCSICHGSDGKGKGKLAVVYDMQPADHTDAAAMEKISNEKMYRLIADGTAGAKLMLGWKDILSSDEIKDVISYIRLLSEK
jgi:mono/diheme cytochrome c family protein